MAITIAQTATAVGRTAPANFHASGGTGPYVYSILGGGAGGVINASTGNYTAPSIVPSDPLKNYDTIRVVDTLDASATTRIAVYTPLLLFCDIIRKQLALSESRVYLWDQKIMEPSDNGLFIAISQISCNPFGNSNRTSSDGEFSEQYVSMSSTVTVDIISRDASARDRKEEIIMALESNYARTQQDANGFYIGKISTGFINLSQVDGAAIPYRFQVSVALQYVSVITPASDYFDDIQFTTITDP